MSRILNIAAAQMGPIPRSSSRADAVERLIVLLHEAQRRGSQFIVFPECALTPFFSHWFMEAGAELDSYFEREMPNAATAPLFAEARRLGIAFNLGYAELEQQAGIIRHFNTSILVGKEGEIIGKYRKIHLPGHADHRPQNVFQNLEKRYFEVGDLGFQVWCESNALIGMCICNDRRWPEAYRVLGLQGAELISLGYNTPSHIPDSPELDHLVVFHHLLSLQAGAYQNGAWVVAAAKAGCEEGVMQIGNSVIVAPSGEIAAQSVSLGDEVINYACDLDACRPYKERVFNFAAHRRIEHYGLITSQTGASDPDNTSDPANTR